MKLTKEKFTEILGWYGVLAVVGAYLLLSFELISSKDITYQLLNLTGSIGLLIDAWFDRNYQPVVINVVWAVIAVVGILRVIA